MNTLETARLIIRPFAMADLEEAYRVLDLDLQWAGPNRTIEWRRERLQLYAGLANWDDTGRLYGYRALALKPAGLIIGLCGFHPDYWPPEWIATFWPQLFPGIIPSATGSFELGIGWAVSTHYRGQGYATEAARAMLHHAFIELKIPRVFAVTDNANPASVQVMRRLGMRIANNPDLAVVYPAAAGVIDHDCA